MPEGRTLLRWGVALAALVGVVAVLPQLTARLSHRADAPPETQRGHTIGDISGIAALQEAFNQDLGHVRVVLLLSPT